MNSRSLTLGEGCFSGRLVNSRAKLTEQILQHGAMQAPLISKIVVEHGLIRVRCGRNFFRARAGHALRGEMLFRGGKNSPRGGRVLRLFFFLDASFFLDSYLLHLSWLQRSPADSMPIW